MSTMSKRCSNIVVFFHVIIENFQGQSKKYTIGKLRLWKIFFQLMLLLRFVFAKRRIEREKKQKNNPNRTFFLG